MEHREALLALRTFLSTQILGQEKLIDRLLIALVPVLRLDTSRVLALLAP